VTVIATNSLMVRLVWEGSTSTLVSTRTVKLLVALRL
jgi:hypothetical protein